jgi:hypothetical protein
LDALVAFGRESGTWGSFSKVVSKVAGGMYLQLSRRATEKDVWALRACAITCTVQSPDEEVREEAEHDTPSGTCSLHTPVPPALHPPPVFTEKAVGWRHINQHFPSAGALTRRQRCRKSRWRTLKSHRHGKTNVAASRSRGQQGCPMHRWRLPVCSPQLNAHHLLGCGNGWRV